MHVDPTTMEHRLEALRAFERWPAAEVDRFGRALASADAWALFRINPLHFAERENFDPQMAVDLFVRGAKVGLFDLVWSCVCVFCGAIEYTYDSIDRVPNRSFHCTRCDADIGTWLDERVEVSFSIHASVAELALDPFENFASYERYFTSPSVVHRADTAQYLADIEFGRVLLPADGRGQIDVTLAPGASLRLFSFDRHAHLLLRADESVSTDRRELEVDVLSHAFGCETTVVAAGPLRLRLFNRAPEPTGVMVLDGDVEAYHHQLQSSRASMRPFLSGQMLLCTESFRQLFRVQTLDEELALNVRHVALLFTDLVASTALYDKVGDAAAYGLVRQHFRALHEATEARGGAVVKTMGDAIMAAFCSAADAVRAALDMLARIDALNLELRVGVHVGPAIIVHAQGRLDYFGQVVNVAARVQSLAEAGTLCLSADVLAAPYVAEILEQTARVGGLESVSVRGLASAISVCRVRPGRLH
jgi:class 3 adenylate cyclase